MATWANFLGNNSYGVDASEYEKKLRERDPKVLHSSERVEVAFKSALDGRDKSYLTTHRILLQNGKGLGNKRKNFKSIPYGSIQAFSVETAGSVLDGDVELKIWTSNLHEKLEFGKGVVDIFAVQQFMNHKVLEHQKVQPGTKDPVWSQAQNTHTASSIMDWMGQNARECSPQKMEHQLKNVYSVLMKDETVQLAYQCGRDYTVFTDQRILMVDTQGMTGSRVEFKSIPWAFVQGYSVETPGSFLDYDSELRIFTSIHGIQRIDQDLRKGKGNLWAIQTCLNNHVLGPDEGVLLDVDQKVGHVDPDTSWWGRSNNRPLDAVEMNRVFHSNPPILQSKEVVEMAFKGRRDIILLTTKRIVKVDPKGMSGKRVEYCTIPWRSVIGFAVQTAGKTLDNDAEMMLWTEMMMKKAKAEGEEDEPYWSMWELDFNKKLVDILAVKKYLATRCLTASNALQNIVPLKPNVSDVSKEEKGFEKFLSKIGNDQRAIDPAEMNTLFHTDIPILLENETIVLAFKAGRDATFFTNLRVVAMDVKGLSGKKVEYKSIPYSSIVAFSAESAGSWDQDSEIALHTRNEWTMGETNLDFRKGKADIVLIQKFFASILLAPKEDVERYFKSTGGEFATGGAVNAPNVSSFAKWLSSNSVEISADTVTQQLHSDPSILLDEEHCEKAYRCGRDTYVYTNLRFLKVDVQGITGKKINYLSIPTKHFESFEIETAGHMDADAEVYLQTKKLRVQQDILVKGADIMDMQVYLTNKLMF